MIRWYKTLLAHCRTCGKESQSCTKLSTGGQTVIVFYFMDFIIIGTRSDARLDVWVDVWAIILVGKCPCGILYCFVLSDILSMIVHNSAYRYAGRAVFQPRRPDHCSIVLPLFCFCFVCVYIQPYLPLLPVFFQSS